MTVGARAIVFSKKIEDIEEDGGILQKNGGGCGIPGEAHKATGFEITNWKEVQNLLLQLQLKI